MQLQSLGPSARQPRYSDDSVSHFRYNCIGLVPAFKSIPHNDQKPTTFSLQSCASDAEILRHYRLGGHAHAQAPACGANADLLQKRERREQL